jgi:DNA-binding IclR family transcriptional regulator
VYLEKITASGGCRIPSRVGITLPVTCTSLGKAMLAFSSTRNVADILSRPLPCLTPYSVVNPRVLASELTEIRQSGVAVDRDGARLGVSCVAAPVVLAGQAIAAVSVAGWGDSFSPPRYANLVRQAATRITALLS